MDNGVSFRILAARSGDPEVIAGRRAFGGLRRGFWVDYLGTEREIDGCEQDLYDPYADAFGAFNGQLLVGARILEGNRLAGPLPIQEYLDYGLPDDAVEISRLVAAPGVRSPEIMTAFLVWLITIAAERGSSVYMNINTDALSAIEHRASRFGYSGLLEAIPGKRMQITARDRRKIAFIPMILNPAVLDPDWVDTLLQKLLPPSVES